MVCKPFVLGKLPILGNTILSSIESQPKKVIVVVVVVIVIIVDVVVAHVVVILIAVVDPRNVPLKFNLNQVINR